MACSSGCPTGGHATYGECLRSKGIQVADVSAHQFRVNKDAEISAYVDARYSGMQPDSTSAQDVAFARRISEKHGTPYRADAAPDVSAA